MSIYQDWKPVDIGYGSKIRKNTSFSYNKKETPEDGIPPSVMGWTNELCVSLQQLRLAKGMTQKEVAMNLNLPSTTLSDIEANKSLYNPTLYKKIFRYLGGDPNSLNFPPKVK
jgi:DNA-binding XRE family transcriptional regulator